MNIPKYYTHFNEFLTSNHYATTPSQPEKSSFDLRLTKWFGQRGLAICDDALAAWHPCRAYKPLCD